MTDQCETHREPLMLADDGVAFSFYYCPSCQREGVYVKKRLEREAAKRQEFQRRHPRMARLRQVIGK